MQGLFLDYLGLIESFLIAQFNISDYGPRARLWGTLIQNVRKGIICKSLRRSQIKKVNVSTQSLHF